MRRDERERTHVRTLSGNKKRTVKPAANDLWAVNQVQSAQQKERKSGNKRVVLWQRVTVRPYTILHKRCRPVVVSLIRSEKPFGIVNSLRPINYCFLAPFERGRLTVYFYAVFPLHATIKETWHAKQAVAAFLSSRVTPQDKTRRKTRH